jgi:REP element-mobilizing transposase RayT
MKALAVGGSENHLHILLSVPNTLDLASALHLIKNGSAEFLNEHLDGTFSWQEGYGAFTVQLPAGNDNSLKGLFLAKNGVVLDARCCLKMNS